MGLSIACLQSGSVPSFWTSGCAGPMMLLGDAKDSNMRRIISRQELMTLFLVGWLWPMAYVFWHKAGTAVWVAGWRFPSVAHDILPDTGFDQVVLSYTVCLVGICLAIALYGWWSNRKARARWNIA